LLALCRPAAFGSRARFVVALGLAGGRCSPAARLSGRIAAIICRDSRHRIEPWSVPRSTASQVPFRCRRRRPRYRVPVQGRRWSTYCGTRSTGANWNRAAPTASSLAVLRVPRCRPLDASAVRKPGSLRLPKTSLPSPCPVSGYHCFARPGGQASPYRSAAPPPSAVAILVAEQKLIVEQSTTPSKNDCSRSGFQQKLVSTSAIHRVAMIQHS